MFAPSDWSSARPPRRHLLYHVWPVRDSNWRSNLEQLLARIDVFNGRRLVAIVHDERSEAPEVVMQQLAGQGCEFIVHPNHPAAEAHTFPELLARVAGEPARDVSFYAHAKGVKYGRRISPAVRTWCDALYTTCLDDWLRVRSDLSRAALTGAFRRFGRFAAHRNLAPWHYSGTFFWLRHDRVFARTPLTVPHFYGGVETWPGLHFDASESACLFFDQLDALPYDEVFWAQRGRPALAAWRGQVRRLSPPPDLEQPVTLGSTSGPRLEQKPEEFIWFMRALIEARVERLLVIGSLHGGVEWQAARLFREQGLDLELTSLDVRVTPELRRSLADAQRSFGQRTRAVEADAGRPEARTHLAPAYDAVFIDADHGYATTCAQWDLARSLGARLVGFHDIVDSDWHVQNRCCVERLWSQLRATHTTEERTGGDWGGIGLVRL